MSGDVEAGLESAGAVLVGGAAGYFAGAGAFPKRKHAATVGSLAGAAIGGAVMAIVRERNCEQTTQQLQVKFP